METFTILFTNSGKTLNVFKGDNALDAVFIMDYKFETKQDALDFAEILRLTRNYKIKTV